MRSVKHLVEKDHPGARAFRCRPGSPLWRAEPSFQRRSTFQVWAAGERLDKGVQLCPQTAWKSAFENGREND